MGTSSSLLHGSGFGVPEWGWPKAVITEYQSDWGGTKTVLLPLLCATAQQSYCHHAGVRRPSVKLVFSETVKRIKAKFWWKPTCPPYLRTLFVFYIFDFFFYDFCFIFVNMGPYGSKNFIHLLWKYTSDSLPQIIHTPGGRSLKSALYGKPLIQERK